MITTQWPKGKAILKGRSHDPLEKLFFLRLIKNAPASVPQGGATRRQADAS